MPAWADLDKMVITNPRADGSVLAVARDDRSRADMEATRPLTTLVAICRMLNAKHAIDKQFGGKGKLVYVCSDAPAFVVDAVSAAGGVVLSGGQERSAKAPLAVTMQLDAACCDLATVVRRRLKAPTFEHALELREAELRLRPVDRDDAVAVWTTVLELVAVLGEIVRAKKPGRWVPLPDQRLPIALELGKDELLQPGKLAMTLVEGGDGSMAALLDLLDTGGDSGQLMPLLVHRRSVPIERITWERLIPAEVDSDDVPVISYVKDRGGTFTWPVQPGPPSPEVRERALKNLARVDASCEQLDVPGIRVALVMGEFYAAEKLLDPAFMKRVSSCIGAGSALVVGAPARGEMLAIDATLTMLEPGHLAAFKVMVANGLARAVERNRISMQLIFYDGKPIGRVG